MNKITAQSDVLTPSRLFRTTVRKLTFHADPSHGWLEVPVIDIMALGIIPSEFSHIKGDMVYLEEDCDANEYILAAKANGWTVNITEAYTNNDSPIRNYASWHLLDAFFVNREETQ